MLKSFYKTKEKIEAYHDFALNNEVGIISDFA